MTCAAEHGLCVTKPWGETAHYDFAVENQGRFVRVQVKSTGFKDRGGYSCTVRGSQGPYSGDPFDFVAAYLIPEDLWYIIPAEKFQGRAENRRVARSLWPALTPVPQNLLGHSPSLR